MAVIKISKQYLIEQDDASITVDVPELLLAQWRDQTGGAIASEKSWQGLI
jgi:hypothetical protein